MRQVFFDVNGMPRSILVEDKAQTVSGLQLLGRMQVVSWRRGQGDCMNAGFSEKRRGHGRLSAGVLEKEKQGRG